MILRGAEGPGYTLNVPQLAAQEAAQPVPVGKFVGDEVRPGQEVQQVAGERRLNGQGLPLRVAEKVHGQLPPDDLGAVLFQPEQAPGVEGLDAVRPGVAFQLAAGFCCQSGMVAPHGLQLYNHGGFAAEQLQNLPEGGDGFRCAFQRIVFQILRGEVFDAPGCAGGAL